ncbi:MAG: replication-relaxation family protein [Acidimicrobiales bacterium]
MFENPTSATDRSRAPSRPICVQPPLDTAPGNPAAVSPSPLGAADRRLLALIGEHEVLTSGQLIRLTAMPERTVQYRLDVLYRAGLVNRFRPRAAAIGTCPYHIWLTPFGAAAIGAEPPRPWSEDLVGLPTMAALCDLWLGLRDHGPGLGLVVTGWRRLRAGVTYADRRTGEERRLLADAELTAHVGAGGRIEAALCARVDHIPAARLASVVGRWIDYFAAAPASEPRMALVLTRSAQQRAGILAAVRGAGNTPTIRNLDQPTSARAVRRVAVGLIESRAPALATEPVWRTPADDDDRRLVEVLTGAAGVGR